MNYEHLRAIITREIHTLDVRDGKAAISIGNPARVHRTDYSVFKKDMNERMKVFTLKSQLENPSKKLALIGRYHF